MEEIAMSSNRMTFVNLPVKNLPATMDFFTKLGFTFNPQFTDDNAACMIISDDSWVMLLKEEFFKTFTKKAITDTRESTEVIVAVSAASRKEADELADKALAAGGKPLRDPEDYGWMYSRSFQDLDGHLWEVGYMDIDALNGQKPS
jgi:uncharacterized protein